MSTFDAGIHFQIDVDQGLALGQTVSKVSYASRTRAFAVNSHAQERTNKFMKNTA